MHAQLIIMDPRRIRRLKGRNAYLDDLSKIIKNECVTLLLTVIIAFKIFMSKQLKAHNHLFWLIFLNITFYDLKVTCPKLLCQNIHRKYEYFENKHCIFWSKHGCFTASLDILNF